MAHHEIETTIIINAPPSRVWQVLTNFNGFRTWNRFIRSINGQLKEGARLSIEIKPPGKSAIRFRPTVLVVRPEQELRWLGSLLIPRLFDGEHYFILRAQDSASTRLVHGEKFSGLLVRPFADRGMLQATREGFEAMNIALKERAEEQTT